MPCSRPCASPKESNREKVQSLAVQVVRTSLSSSPLLDPAYLGVLPLVGSQKMQTGTAMASSTSPAPPAAVAPPTPPPTNMPAIDTLLLHQDFIRLDAAVDEVTRTISELLGELVRASKARVAAVAALADLRVERQWLLDDELSGACPSSQSSHSDALILPRCSPTPFPRPPRRSPS